MKVFEMPTNDLKICIPIWEKHIKDGIAPEVAQDLINAAKHELNLREKKC